jgi:16S rRNA (adenine1518-N6/adenine1519-N6)-dimethyltransferase
MKLSEMKQTLLQRDLKLTKSLGQNFLHDQNQLQRIVAAAELGPADKALEIGPGLGPLTVLLLEKAAEVLAIEKDRRLFDFLAEKFPHSPTLELLHADALDYIREHPRWNGWKLVANLPYSVASTLLVELAHADEPPDRMVATLQIEVARRIDAAPGAPDYGVLGLLLGLRYQWCGSFKIPASCFFPSPGVDSACIVLARRTKPLLPAGMHAAFDKVVRRGFSQRRKMMLKLLKQDWPEAALRAAFERLGISTQTRAEQVSLEQFARLTEILSHE